MASTLDLAAPLDSAALAAAKAFLSQLPSLPRGSIGRIYDHWFVANSYQVCDAAYNIEARKNAAGVWVLTITHPLEDNAHGVNDNKPAAHTYRRNTGAVGICTTGMGGATVQNFGGYPITRQELEFLAAANAAVALKYGLDTMASAGPTPYSNGAPEHVIMTHAEAALATYSTGDDGTHYPHYYCFKAGGDPGCRWDHATDDPQSAAPDEAQAYANGSLIRARSHQYKLVLPK